MSVLTLANGQTFNTANLIATDFVKPKKSKFNSMLVWQGPSVLNGENIAVFATLKSTNSKTGDMVQVSILRTDRAPLDAIKDGSDVAICGTCLHRRKTGGACYVNVGQGPQAIYKAFKRGNVSDYDLDAFRGRMVRFGSYGDPAAIPVHIMQAIASVAKGYTGYTHQLRHKNFDTRVLQFCQVSADSAKQAQAIQAKGHKTFRVKLASQPILENEIECLADAKGLSCLECGLCDGQKANIVINIHGSLQSRFKG